MSLLLSILFLLSAGSSRPAEIEVDKIEINMLHGNFTQRFNRWEVPVYVPVMQQAIFWEWNQEYNRYNVIAWATLYQSVAIESEDGRNKWYSFQEDKPHYLNKGKDYHYLKINIDNKNYLVRTKNLVFTECDLSQDPERANKQLFDSRYRNLIFR